MKNYLKIVALGALLSNCKSADNEFAKRSAVVLETDTVEIAEVKEEFKVVAEEFADLRILRYQVPGFEQLDLKTKTLAYYLYEAALCGRDMIYDQNFKYNIQVRKTLEALLAENGAANGEEYEKLENYAKRVWFSNGIHHHYSHDKFTPECSPDFVRDLLNKMDVKKLPLQQDQSKEAFVSFIMPVMFDPTIAPKKVNLDAKQDLLQSSAVNFYEGVTEKEATDFYKAQVNRKSKENPSYGLNSKLVKENGVLTEKVWKVGGLYSPAIEKIVFWLEKASTVAENQTQKAAIDGLAKYYRSGSLVDFDSYSIQWLNDTASVVDVVNGFIEVYSDPIGKKGSYESIVSIKDMEASKRIEKISENAQWFEDNSTILPQHKKKKVVGITAKVITVVVQGGDAAPPSSIGVNLPNNEWIRNVHGSKSVNLGNIVEAYGKASGGSVVNEFYFDDKTKKSVRDYAGLADKLHTDMHEAIGHASGEIEDGVGRPSETLKNYASALEEGRADLVALYYLMDQKLVDLGVMPSLDYGKAAYDEYITNGLIVQLARIELGKDIEEAHMRNRKFVSEWCFEKGKKDKVIEKKSVNGKTYFVINDYLKLRTLFGELLRELQRISSQGDFKAGKAIVETYGVKIDQVLHKEVLERYARLNIKPYAGFIQPKLIPVMEDNSIKDVKVEYPSDFKQQMLEYGRNYSFLSVYN